MINEKNSDKHIQTTTLGSLSPNDHQIMCGQKKRCDIGILFFFRFLFCKINKKKYSYLEKILANLHECNKIIIIIMVEKKPPSPPSEY